MSYLQDDCTADTIDDMPCAMPGADRRWVHLRSDHMQCMPEGCYYHEYQPPTEVEAVREERPTVSYINITPSDEGYAAIAVTFLDSILRDVPPKRHLAVADQLHQVLTIVGHLAQHGRPELAADIIAHVDTSRE